MLLLLFGVFFEFFFYAFARNPRGGDRVLRVAQHANDLCREDGLQDIDGLLYVTLVSRSDRTMFEAFACLGAQLLYVCKEWLIIGHTIILANSRKRFPSVRNDHQNMGLPRLLLPLLIGGAILAQLPPPPPPGGSAGVRKKLAEVHPAGAVESKSLDGSALSTKLKSTCSLDPKPPRRVGPTAPIEEGLKNCIATLEKSLLDRAMIFAGGNKSKAADLLKIHRRLLYEKLREYELKADTE